MPNVKVVNDMGQDFLHAACDRSVSVRDKSCYCDTTAQQIFHTLFESHEFHGWTTACLVSLENIKRAVQIMCKYLDNHFSCHLILVFIIIIQEVH